MAEETDVDFSQVKGVRIPQGEVKYIVGHDQAIHNGDGKALLWRRPNEFPYCIGAYTYTNAAGNSYEHFSNYYIEKYREPVDVKSTYLPTHNSNVNTQHHIMATSTLVGTLLNGYYCNNETDCQNLHIPSMRKKLGNAAYAYWRSLDAEKKKILVYASKGQTAMTVFTAYPQHIEGAPTFLRYQYTPPLYLETGFPVPYGEVNTPELCRVLDTTTPIVRITTTTQGQYGTGLYARYPTNKITAVREDYSDLIKAYDEITSGAYPKSEYPYLDGVTELGFTCNDLITGKVITLGVLDRVFAFYVFFRVAR